MLVLDFCNYVLRLCGEQPLLSTTGNLGALVRSSINTSILSVVQSARVSYFEQLVTMTSSNEDYLVPVGSLPTSVAQVYDVWLLNTETNELIRMEHQQLEHLDGVYPYYSYSVQGSNVHVNSRVVRPLTLRLQCLNVPTLPLADDSELNLPDTIQPAVAHTAASIILVSYVDDTNAASIQQRMADTLVNNLRSQFGNTRGKRYNMGNNNNRVWTHI